MDTRNPIYDESIDHTVGNDNIPHNFVNDSDTSRTCSTTEATKSANCLHTLIGNSFLRSEE